MLRLALLLTALFFIPAPSFCANQPQPIKVLVLYFGDKDSPGVGVFLSSLRTRMEQEVNGPVWIYEESFDEGGWGATPITSARWKCSCSTSTQNAELMSSWQ